MRRFLFVVMGTMLAVSLAVAQSPRGAAPRTPWGDPDLQGTWSSDDTDDVKEDSQTLMVPGAG